MAHSLHVRGKDLGAVQALDRPILLLSNHVRMVGGEVCVQGDLLAKALLARPTHVGSALVDLAIMPSSSFQREEPLLLAAGAAALAALEALLGVLMCCRKVTAQRFRGQDHHLTFWTLSGDACVSGF